MSEGIQRGRDLSISVMVFSIEGVVVPPNPSYQIRVVGQAGGFEPKDFPQWETEATDYVGLFSDKTYLSLVDTDSSLHEEKVLNTQTIERYRLFDLAQLEQKASRVPVLSAGLVHLGHTVEHHLRTYLNVRKEILELFLGVLAQQYPQYHETAKTYLGQSNYRESMVMVMARPNFEAFRDVVKTVSASFFQKVESSKLSVQELRTFRAFLPLLLQAFVDTEPKLESESSAVVRFSITDAPLFLARWKTEAVPVVFAANEHFAPALGVCLTSLLEHIDVGNAYDIVVLTSDMAEESKRRLLLQCQGYPQVLLRFFDPVSLLAGRHLEKNPADHISVETYYRFLIADILKEYGKVLYLDCDTVILEDVAKLYATDLKGKVLAAALDPEIPAQVMGVDSGMAVYLKQALGMDAGDPYLQAGVLVLDLDEMRLLHSVDEWLALAAQRKYRFNDQDILNKECRGMWTILPMAWNTVVDCNHRRLPIIEAGPLAVWEAYIEARKHPFLIHYAGFEKPWDAPDSDFAEVFYKYARHSEFYERLLAMLFDGGKHSKKQGGVLTRLFPRGSKRRILAKKVFYRFSGR